MNKKYTIFIIDDKLENIQYLKAILEEEYIIKGSCNAQFVLDNIHLQNPDLILLDIKMPQIDGFTLCKKLKKIHKLKDIPIIFLSALDDINSKVKAFENGGSDYLCKPFEEKEIKARIKTQISLYENNKTISKLLKDQEFFLKKIIHEINTPLSIIRLNINSVEKKTGFFEEFDSIKASIKSLSSIYDDLYYLSKKQIKQKELEELNLSKFISKRVNFFQELAKIKQLDIQVHINEDISINIDKYEFERLIDNTISNAIKYSYENTSINIFIENRYLKIQNNGIVIQEEENIFEAYYQENDTYGLGLGLNIIKDICDKYEILVKVDSDENYTQFSYDLLKVKV